MGKKKPKKSKEDGEIRRVEGSDDPVLQTQLLIDSWNARNDLYQQLLGDYSYVTPDNYRPPRPLHRDTVDGGANLQGEEMQLAVLAYGPDPFRPYWTYITAGLCSPWLQSEPAEVSGFGCELMIKSPVDATWPSQVLKSMAYYIFNHVGTLSPGVRIKLNAPIAPNSDSQLRNLFIWYADEAPDCWYILPSGGFGIFCAVGMTEDESNYAESVEDYGAWCIQEALRQTGHGQVTDPNRLSIIKDENMAILSGFRTFAFNFRQTNDGIGPDVAR